MRGILSIFFLFIIPIAITIINISHPSKGEGVEFYIEDLGFILVLGYGFYPLLYSSEKLFRGKVAKSIINEYRSVKRILYMEFPIMIILLIMLLFGSGLHEYLGPNLAYPVIAGIIWILIIRRKGYQYYFAKAYIIKSLETKDTIEKIKYLINGIKYYSKYLQGNIGYGITDIDKVQSKLSNISIDEQNNLIQSLFQAFENADKGKPKEILQSIFNIEIVRINQMAKIRYQLISEKGVVVLIIIPAVQIIAPYLPK